MEKYVIHIGILVAFLFAGVSCIYEGESMVQNSTLSPTGNFKVKISRYQLPPPRRPGGLPRTKRLPRRLFFPRLMPRVNIPKLHLPKFELPKLEIKLPKFELPKFQIRPEQLLPKHLQSKFKLQPDHLQNVKVQPEILREMLKRYGLSEKLLPKLLERAGPSLSLKPRLESPVSGELLPGSPGSGGSRIKPSSDGNSMIKDSELQSSPKIKQPRDENSHREGTNHAGDNYEGDNHERDHHAGDNHEGEHQEKGNQETDHQEGSNHQYEPHSPKKDKESHHPHIHIHEEHHQEDDEQTHPPVMHIHLLKEEDEHSNPHHQTPQNKTGEFKVQNVPHSSRDKPRVQSRRISPKIVAVATVLSVLVTIFLIIGCFFYWNRPPIIKVESRLNRSDPAAVELQTLQSFTSTQCLVPKKTVA